MNKQQTQNTKNYLEQNGKKIIIPYDGYAIDGHTEFCTTEQIDQSIDNILSSNNKPRVYVQEISRER